MGSSSLPLPQHNVLSKEDGSSVIQFQSGLIVQRYQIGYPSKEQMVRAHRQYQLRKHHFSADSNVVNVLDIESKQESQWCSTNYRIRLDIQRVSHRLVDLHGLQENKALFALYKIGQGVNQLVRIYGCRFTINSKMIGLNQQGQFKVWFNQNFQSNEPEFFYFQRTPQNLLVQQLLEIAMQLSSNGLSQRFLDFISQIKDKMRVADLIHKIQEYSMLYYAQVQQMSRRI